MLGGLLEDNKRQRVSRKHGVRGKRSEGQSNEFDARGPEEIQKCEVGIMN